MSYSNTGRRHNYDDNTYELPSLQQHQHQTRGSGGYVRTDDQDDQDDVPIHSRSRQSRLGMSAPPPPRMNSNYPSYNDEYGDNTGHQQSSGFAPHMRQSAYGASYTDTPESQERYDNPFEQAAAAAQQPDFDIMADFNNAGPRYSNIYGIAPDESMRELVKHGGRPVTSYRPQSAHVDLAKPYRPKSKMGSILSPDEQQRGGEEEEEYRDSPIERSYSTRHSTKQGKRAGNKSRAKPLLADANWDTSRHDVVRGDDDEDDERWGSSGMGGKTRFNTKAKDANGVELVTVPALGPEWGKDESAMGTRRVRRQLQNEKRKMVWKEFIRSQRGLCGIPWLTYKVLTFIFFGFVVALCVVLFLTIPRAPSFKFPSNDIMGVDNSTVAFSRTPANFSFAGSINMVADSTASYLPVYFTNLEISVLDHTTNKEIATGNWRNHKLARGDAEFVSLPVEFAYQGVNASDTTWANMYDACGHIWTGTTRQDIQIEVVLKMHIRGLVTVPVTSRAVTGIQCPFELPSNGV